MNQPTGQNKKLTGRGGAGRGQGRKKGKKEPKTLEKEKELERIRQIVYKNTDKLMSAKMSLALGTRVLMRRKWNDKLNRYERAEQVADEKEIACVISEINGPEGSLDEGDYYFWIEAQRPEGRDIDNIWDRAFGKPPQSIDLGNKDDKPFLIRIDT